jgi:toxin ParE1/3/4
VAIFRHYGRQAGLRTARRFLAEAEATFGRLASLPGLGTRYEPDHPRISDLRYFPVSRFKNYLVFYRPIENGVEIVRVLHGARDIPSILADDPDIRDDADEDTTANEGEEGQ